MLTASSPDILIKCENVSKKFCRSFKQSLGYGLKDVMGTMLGIKTDHDQLRKNEFWAVKEINFELRRGECLGLIGHNGAGKSTLLKMLNGLITPDQGKITMRGRVGALIELGAGFNPILTGRENIYNNGAVLGFTREEIDAKVDKIIEFSEIGEFIDSPVQNYSSGMKVRLGFAVAAQMEPDILLIDEVLAVGDVGFKFKCLNAIGELMKKCAVIFVSHTMPQVFKICNQIMLLNHGETLYYGNKIGKGVEMYFNMFKGEDKIIAGSGEATLTAFKIKSGNKSAELGERIPIEHGSKVSIDLQIKLEKHIPSARVQVLLWNLDMIPVMDILDASDSPLNGYHIYQNETGLHRISLSIEKLLVNSGKHSISVIINSPTMDKHYCRYDKAAEIISTATFASGANTLYPAQWETI